MDVWREYKRLADAGWERERIKTAKGVTDSRVSERLKYAEFPNRVLAVFSKWDFLKESHAAEISKFSNLENMSPWLTRDAAMLEVLQSVIAKYGKDVTAKHIAAWVVAVPTDPAHSTILGPSRPRRS